MAVRRDGVCVYGRNPLISQMQDVDARHFLSQTEYPVPAHLAGR
jgi:hypothetical protein